MNVLSNTHSYGGVSRRILMTASSEAALGLRASDIVNVGAPSEPNRLSGRADRKPASLDEQVFQALAAAKVWTSKVVMHMSLHERDRYFRQIDLLHDLDEWLGDEKPMRVESYKSFIRFMLLAGGSSKPSLGLSPMGHLVAAWIAGSDRLTVEFKENDHVEWVVSRRIADVTERVAGHTALNRLQANLAPYQPEAWFNVA